MTSPDTIEYIIVCEKPSGMWLDVGVQKGSGIRRVDHKLKELANGMWQRAEEKSRRHFGLFAIARLVKRQQKANDRLTDACVAEKKDGGGSGRFVKFEGGLRR